MSRLRDRRDIGSHVASRAAGETRWLSRDHVRAIALLLVTAAAVWVCYQLTAPFLPALAWSLALAIAVVPVQRRLERWLGLPNLAATISVLMTALVVLVPAAFVAERLVTEAGKAADAITIAAHSGSWRDALEVHPQLAPFGALVERQLDVPGTISSLTTWVTTASATFVRGSVTQLFSTVLTFYLLFYFLRDRHAIARLIRELSPLSGDETDRMSVRVIDTVNATIYGTVTVAAVQGLLGGLMFWWLDLPGPLVWGVVMGLLAIVPVLGAFVVWLPAALVLALQGQWGDALLLTAWGLFVVGAIDNLLYPMLVGNRLKLHTVPALISIIGGIALFGPSGLILGPVAIAATVSLFEMWRARIAV